MEDLTLEPKVAGMNQLMASIEAEIIAVKSGELKEATARLVFKGRSLQMKGLDLYLQAARMESKLRRGLRVRMGEEEVEMKSSTG